MAPSKLPNTTAQNRSEIRLAALFTLRGRTKEDHYRYRRNPSRKKAAGAGCNIAATVITGTKPIR